MKLVRDYCTFTMSFIGLGYIVLWPLTAHDSGIATLEAALMCGGDLWGLASAICQAPYKFELSPGLHLIGNLAAICALLRLLVRVLWRRRRRTVSAADIAAARALAVASARPSRSGGWNSHWAQPPRPVRPRKQFGLRGTAQQDTACGINGTPALSALGHDR